MAQVLDNIGTSLQFSDHYDSGCQCSKMTTAVPVLHLTDDWNGTSFNEHPLLAGLLMEASAANDIPCQDAYETSDATNM